MYHNFFIHSFDDGHLGCFHVLAIVNSTTVNTGVNVSFRMVLSGYMPSTGIAGLYDSFISSFFKELSILFSIVTVSIYIPTSGARGFPFLHILSSIYCCRCFDDGHSDLCEVMVIAVVLICIALTVSSAEHLSCVY